jgi:hypothetical protein
VGLIVTNIRSLGTAARPASDLDVDRLILRGEKRLTVNLKGLIVEGTLEQTIEGASTLTIVVRDAERGLLRSSLVRTRSMMWVDGIWYSLAKVSRQGNAVTLLFEETAVSLLRRYQRPRKANRANTTRAQFVRTLVKEVREATIPFRIPEVNERQPIAKA